MRAPAAFLVCLGIGIGFILGSRFGHPPALAAPIPLRLAMPPGAWPVELTVHDVDGAPVRMRFACQGETSR